MAYSPERQIDDYTDDNDNYEPPCPDEWYDGKRDWEDMQNENGSRNKSGV